MTPEQARGKAVDKRADVWAFGCVLYEMLAARSPFAGETISDTIAKTLEREPDWHALPASTPKRIRELLRRCLQKDPHDRLHHIADARIEIEEVQAGRSASPPVFRTLASGGRSHGDAGARGWRLVVRGEIQSARPARAVVGRYRRFSESHERCGI